MSTVAAIVQARLGSSRLPLKSLVSLNGLPIIDWVVARLAQSSLLDAILVAVPDTKLDLALALHLRQKGVNCIAGPEDDVLARFVCAANAIHADIIVRVCADNPFIWAEAVDRLIDFYNTTGCDYAWNHIPRDNLWPDGLGAEIIAAGLLREIDKAATLPSQREHCLNYIWDNAELFSCETFDPVETWLQRPDIKLDIDTPQDYGRLAGLNIEPEMDARAIVQAWDNGIENEHRTRQALAGIRKTLSQAGA